MEKSEIKKILLTGLVDDELKKIQDENARKALEITTIIHYTKLFKKEMERLKSNKKIPAEKVEVSNDKRKIVEALKDSYSLLLKAKVSTPHVSLPFMQLQKTIKNHQIHSTARRQEYLKMHKHCEEIMQDSQFAVKTAKIKSLKSNLVNAEQEYQKLQEDLQECVRQNQEKKARHDARMAQKRRELEDIERQLNDQRKFINSAIEDDLELEIAELKAKEKELNKKLGLVDDDGSSASSFFDLKKDAPVVEKVTMDLKSFLFKNPNDFPTLAKKTSTPKAVKADEKENDAPQTSLKQKVSPTEADSSSAKKFCGEGRQLKPSNDRAKPPVLQMPRLKSPISRIDRVPVKPRISPLVPRVIRKVSSLPVPIFQSRPVTPKDVQKSAPVQEKVSIKTVLPTPSTSGTSRAAAKSVPAKKTAVVVSQPPPRLLRSSLKRKSIETPQDKQKKVKILSVEFLPPLPKQQSDIVESSEPEKQEVFKPRNLEKDFEPKEKEKVQKEKEKVQEKKEKVQEEKKSEEINIPETPKDDEEEQENAEENEKLQKIKEDVMKASFNAEKTSKNDSLDDLFANKNEVPMEVPPSPGSGMQFLNVSGGEAASDDENFSVFGPEVKKPEEKGKGFSIF